MIILNRKTKISRTLRVTFLDTVIISRTGGKTTEQTVQLQLIGEYTKEEAIEQVKEIYPNTIIEVLDIYCKTCKYEMTLDKFIDNSVVTIDESENN